MGSRRELRKLSETQVKKFDEINGSLQELLTKSDDIAQQQRENFLRLAYELANTVAYLHSVGIIVKNISDTNVVVVKLEGGSRLQPRLTNLEQARRVSEIRAI